MLRHGYGPSLFIYLALTFTFYDYVHYLVDSHLWRAKRYSNRAWNGNTRTTIARFIYVPHTYTYYMTVVVIQTGRVQWMTRPCVCACLLFVLPTKLVPRYHTVPYISRPPPDTTCCRPPKTTPYRAVNHTIPNSNQPDPTHSSEHKHRPSQPPSQKPYETK